jgi:hypothetical protein
LLVMSGDLCGIAPRREISIAYPPDLNMLHFERMHDRLLDHATGMLPAQRFDRFRQTHIIFRTRGEYGKFLHFEHFGLSAGLRQQREDAAVRTTGAAHPAKLEETGGETSIRGEHAFRSAGHAALVASRLARGSSNSWNCAPTRSYLALGTGLASPDVSTKKS